MDMPTIDCYMGNKQANAIQVSLGGVDVYFSYTTPVAFRAKGRLVVRGNNWGPTTGRHLNEIDGGSADRKARRVDAYDFERLYAELVGEVSP